MINKRKEQVIHKAHELFIEKGYHATSIQDILNHSRISKGSFYNYFPSKGDLFKAVFTSIHIQLEEGRNSLIIGQDPSDIKIFAEQIQLVMKINKKNKLLQLVEDALVSNDPDLITFIKKTKFSLLTWVYERFLHIFPEDKKPYLLDGAIIFNGILQNMLQINSAMNEVITSEQIINYCTTLIQTIVEEVSQRGIQLISPDHVDKLLPASEYSDFFNNDLSFATISLKKIIERSFAPGDANLTNYLKLLYFIQEEIMNNKEPRQFLIESALLSLRTCPNLNETKEFKHYQDVLSKML
ncbi:TetR/AcrR family transcriptional regulator [Paenibacillus sp. FSL R5-0345]|uniref:TetR/AcrR family transcriptional regulator n=1 Tax=Paenibacillus sp. FSL R5-0345 TaxID=1536770 RepID=UPI000AF32FF6|nr:TetR/AcrR family transcriptional regulator [Paenibacillus sp. FSL R5-0345]